MSRERVLNILDQVETMDDSSVSKLNLVREAVQLADAIPDDELAYDARMELVKCGTFSGNYDVAFVAYSWCRNYSKRAVNYSDHQSLLWAGKWVVSIGTHVPSVSRESIEELLSDLENSLLEHGYSPRPAYGCRVSVYKSMGLLDEAKSLAMKWLNADCDDLCDCHTCEVHNHALLKIALGENKSALEIAKPILDGQLNCVTKPEATYPAMVIPLLRLNELGRVRELLRVGYPLVRGKKLYIDSTARFMIAQVRSQDWDKAIDNFNASSRLAVETTSIAAKYDFFCGALALVTEMMKANISIQSLKIPKEWKWHQANGDTKSRQLLEWIEDQAQRIGHDFDKRNGNEFFANQRLEWLRLAAQN